jgi:hypothetical protein
MVLANPDHVHIVNFRIDERDIRWQASLGFRVQGLGFRVYNLGWRFRVDEKAGERIIRVCQNRIYIHCIPYMTVYLVPAKNTVYALCIYGSGQPYTSSVPYC